MVGASKILTVSYGTFSCTLEGFDDPFTTMKAIAEYFRDLAANDRFFGAEPPTPDVQMLHAIAQQNTEAPVDAKVEESGLRLTQSDTPTSDTEKPQRKKKSKNKGKKKKNKAKRVSSAISVAAMDQIPGPEEEDAQVAEVAAIETKDHQTDVDDVTAPDVAADVEEPAASAFEMFLDEQTRTAGDENPDDYVVEAGDYETQDDAITALVADETASDEDTTTDVSDADDFQIAEFGEEPNDDEFVESETASDEPEATVETDAEDEFEASEVALDDFSEMEEGADDSAEPLETEDEVLATQDDTTEDVSEAVAAFDAADASDMEVEDDSTPIPAVNRFAPVEQTVAEIEGLVSIDVPTAPTELDAMEMDVVGTVDNGLQSDDFEDATSSTDHLESDVSDDQDASNVAAFAPLEKIEGDDATSENMFTDEVDDEQDSAEFDNDVAALFAVDEGDEDNADGNEFEVTDLSDDERASDAEPHAEKPGLLSAASIAAKLQRIRAVVTSSVGGGDSTLSKGEFADEDTLEEDPLEEDGETTPEAGWTETPDTAEDLSEAEGWSEAEDWTEAEDDEVAEAFVADAHRGPSPIEVSEEDLEAAAEISSGVGSHRPEAFKQTLESFNRDEPSSLSDEDEADLISQLAEASEFAETNSKDGRAILEGDAIEKEEEALERLLEQTNTRLNEDTTQRRQSALSHLKAAVAATIADRNDAQTPVEEDPNKDADSDYRNDLADIVRPKRVTKQERATNSTVAPLVLVPQAKVDEVGEEEEASSVEPIAFDVPEGGVRPRRISRDEMAASNADLDTGFSDYAEQVGADDLKELLEAAAAYLNKVEGRPHFSRPQVMHIVMRHDPERSFSREDSLRSFGELLRNGAIEKVDRGQFVISNESKYLAAS